MTAVQFIQHFPDAIILIDTHIKSKEDLKLTFEKQENFNFMREHIPYYLKYKEVPFEMHPRLGKKYSDDPEELEPIEQFIELKVIFK